MYEGSGCFECGGTGFRGRTAIHELLDLSDKIREMIMEKRSTAEIRRLAREEGIGVLAALHDLNLAADHCDRLILLADGRMAAAGPPDKADPHRRQDVERIRRSPHEARLKQRRAP